MSETRRYTEALPFAREAVELLELALPRDHPALIQPLQDLGRVYRALGAYRTIITGRYPKRQEDYLEAKKLFQRALSLLENIETRIMLK